MQRAIGNASVRSMVARYLFMIVCGILLSSSQLEAGSPRTSSLQQGSTPDQCAKRNDAQAHDKSLTTLNATALRQALSVPSKAISPGGVIQIKNVVVSDVLEMKGLHSASPVQFSNVRFQRDVRFQGAVFEDDVRFDRTMFVGSAEFTGVRIGGKLGVKETCFAQLADFERASIGSANFTSSEFQGSKEDMPDFTEMHVDGKLEFSKVRFIGSVDFNKITVGRTFILSGPTVFQDSVDFGEAVIGGNFDLRGARFLGRDSWFDGMQVGKTAKFHGAVLTGGYSIGDMTYHDITVAEQGRGKKEKWGALLAFVDRASLSIPMYKNLEKYALSDYPEIADEVFVHQKKRDRNQNLHGLSWLLNLVFLEWLVGCHQR